MTFIKLHAIYYLYIFNAFVNSAATLCLWYVRLSIIVSDLEYNLYEDALILLKISILNNVCLFLTKLSLLKLTKELKCVNVKHVQITHYLMQSIFI